MKLIICVSLIIASINIGATTIDFETELNRLISPGFEELQSEFIFDSVICYKNIPEKIINKALDKHFNRIEHMCFLTGEK